MTQKLSLKTPAKINLALRVFGKRHDGYHDIETILQMIGIYDHLVLEKAPSGISLKCNKPEIPTDENNLVIKAAQILKNAFPKQTREGVSINLYKSIPSGAGLGGGSGNAAGALIALNCFWDLRLKSEDLLPLAASLGSDVPFFLVAPCAFGTGRGEQISPLKSFKKFNVVVIYPGICIPTRWTYGNLNLKLTKKENNISIFQNFSSISDISELGSFLHNDLEPIVFESYPEILRMRDRLSNLGAEGVLMSGSGSAVFGIFTDLKKAERTYSVLKTEFFDVFLGQTVQDFSEFLPEDILNYPWA